MVGLFLGVETLGWSIQQFKQAFEFMFNAGIDEVVLKIYEITQGEWYSDIGGPDAVIKCAQDVGLSVLPYGYFYGATTKEIKYVLSALEKYDRPEQVERIPQLEGDAP